MTARDTPTREALVERWRRIVNELQTAHGPERAALVQQLRQIEGEAMTLIRHEQEQEAAR